MRILVTSGATREPIDAVRFLSNVSTGRTGALLAETLARHGHAVTLLHGEGAVRPTAPDTTISTEAFSSTANLQNRLSRLLGTGEFDAVIHAAAVADYRPDEAHAGKLSSYADELTLRLVPTPKLLPTLKAASPRPLKVIGFKLTAEPNLEKRAQAVTKLFTAGTVDAVIHNDMADLASGDTRPFFAWLPQSAPPAPLDGVGALADWLQAFLRK